MLHFVFLLISVIGTLADELRFCVYKIKIKICGRLSEPLHVDTEAHFCYLSGNDGVYQLNQMGEESHHLVAFCFSN